MAINVSVQFNGGFLSDIILLTLCYYHPGSSCLLSLFCLVSLFPINVSVQFNGGFLSDIILLTLCYYHPGTRSNAMKRFCLCSL